MKFENVIKKLNLSCFHVFGCVCFILNDREHFRKFGSKSDEVVFLGYSINSRAYRVYNLRTRTVMELVNVAIDDLRDFAGNPNEEDNVSLGEENGVIEEPKNF